ncbi:MAG: hypothetical protein HXX20_02290 [Chloroflexi bacterium]|nr:hypothetical protein [Chloroflexota bacterium]
MGNLLYKKVSLGIHWGFGIFAAVVLGMFITSHLSAEGLRHLYPIIFPAGVLSATMQIYELTGWLKHRNV